MRKPILVRYVEFLYQAVRVHRDRYGTGQHSKPETPTNSGPIFWAPADPYLLVFNCGLFPHLSAFISFQGFILSSLCKVVFVSILSEVDFLPRICLLGHGKRYHSEIRMIMRRERREALSGGETIQDTCSDDQLHRLSYLRPRRASAGGRRELSLCRIEWGSNNQRLKSLPTAFT